MFEDNSLDLVHIKCSDEYYKYISKMTLAFKMLMNVYKLKQMRDNEASKESKIILLYLKKILYTFQVLRYKYLYNPTDSIKIDKSDSGFLNFTEIRGIETDIHFKEQKINSFDKQRDIKKRMISHMLRYKEEPKAELEKMGALFYYKGLDPDKLFLSFNPGELDFIGISDDKKFNRYSYHWSCYDIKSNMPYIYFLEFEQDIKSEPLENNEENAKLFHKVIKSEGSRVPPAGIVALAIDQRLADIHPKLLKRICIGPIYSSTFSENLEESLDSLLKFGIEGEQFIFHTAEQFVFSEGSHIVKDTGLLGNILEKTKVREQFYVPKVTNIGNYSSFVELEEQRASLIRKSILMSYSIHQHLGDKYENFKIISFSKEGGINGL